MMGHLGSQDILNIALFSTTGLKKVKVYVLKNTLNCLGFLGLGETRTKKERG